MITSQGNNVSKSLVYWRHIWQSTWKQNLATRKRIVFFQSERETAREREGEETDKQAGKEKEREENAQCDRKRSDYKKQS